jgi:cytolysin-activating lysine-acyltransferase
MVNIDYYASVGFALELLSRSTYHHHHRLGEYFQSEVLPAIWAQQARFYLTDQGIPAALVTWAWVNEDVEKELHATGRCLIRDEWRCGDRMFINDWVSPYGGVRHYARDMMDNVFPDVQFASSIRRNPDGSVRRINHWNRPDIRKNQERAVS